MSSKQEAHTVYRWEDVTQGCKENDLVIVKTIITREHPLPRYEITKIEGSPMQFLYDRILKNKV